MKYRSYNDFLEGKEHFRGSEELRREKAITNAFLAMVYKTSMNLPALTFLLPYLSFLFCRFAPHIFIPMSKFEPISLLFVKIVPLEVDLNCHCNMNAIGLRYSNE